MAGAKEAEEQDKAVGGPNVDPTKNVLDLVKAESKYQDAMREAESKFQTSLRDAETRRVDNLASLRLHYEGEIAEIQRVQVKTTSDLISAQLDKVTASLSEQISSTATTLGQRISDLDRFRWEVSGRTSVTDPATAESLSRMANAVSALTEGGAKSEGRGLGRNEIIAYLVAAAALGGFAVNYLGS